VYPGSPGYSINNFYSRVGRLTNVTDNAGNSVTNWYSNQGLLIASSNALGQVFKTIYDDMNRPTNSVTADGVAIDQTFDHLNRLLTWPSSPRTTGIGWWMGCGHCAIGRSGQPRGYVGRSR
jgi:uncharacterized protein RhaS with RHS repeats